MLRRDFAVNQSECTNASVPLLRALNSLLASGLCNAASVLFLDESKERGFLALSPSRRGLEASRVSLPLPASFLPSAMSSASPAVFLKGQDAAYLAKALFPDIPFLNAAVAASPMRLSGRQIALLTALCPLEEAENDANPPDALVRELSSLAESAAKAYTSAADFSALHFAPSPAVVESQIMKEKLAVVKAIADTPSPVLFIGEEGTGKEFFARKLHSFSHRSDEPFVCVNCPAFSDALLEKLLFGAENEASCAGEECAVPEESGGAGLFEKAKGGTILFKGIESLSEPMQEKLVAVIQAGCIQKKGGSIPICARVAASTRYDLEKLVAERKFRADLYYALSVIPLYLPSLIARRVDLMPLAYVFLRECVAKTAKPFLFFSAGAEEALLMHSWPSNVRELKNAIARACVAAKPPCITEDDLLLNNPLIPDYNAGADKTLRSAMTLFKKRYIARILAQNGWNQTATAKALGIQRTYLSRLIKELKIREQ